MTGSRRLIPFVLALAALVPSDPAAAIDITDTLMLTQPAISASRLAFVYADDLWVAGLDGSAPRRLTSDRGVEGNPAFSPDGRLLAFSAQYEGNTDVYVVAAEGGVPRRLTWHPGSDQVRGFTPDGTRVLFVSQRATVTPRQFQFWTVPVAGGVEERLPIPYAFKGGYSPDGRYIAYNPHTPAHLQWKNYRGGTVATVVIYDTATHATAKVPQPEGRCNDADPMWLGNTIYFRSDRDGEFNLYAYDPRSKAVTALTRHADFPVLNAAAAAGRIAYEQAGRLHVLDVATRKAVPLTIGLAVDLPDLRPRFAKGTKYVRSVSLSPGGARVAIGFRGEIVTVPAEKGDARNLTGTTAAHEREPAWSPDGASIAYVSDASGENELHVRPQDGKGAVRIFKPGGAGFYERLVWSPDATRIAFADNSFSLYVLTLATGAVAKVDAEPLYGPFRRTAYGWSPDSKWLAYTRTSRTYTNSLFVWSAETGRSTRITDGLSDVSEPVFDRGGKYLFALASTDAGPVNDWFSLAGADMHDTRTIYLVSLRRDTPNPLARESDEEKGPGDGKKDEKAGGGPTAKGDAAARPAAVEVEPTRIDFDGIDQRILALPIPVAELSSLRAGAPGQVFFLRTADGRTALQRFDLSTRKTETVVPEVGGYEVSADGRKLLYRLKDAWFIVAATGKVEPGTGKVPIDAVEVKVDPAAEWPHIFDEAWRVNRDYFYATNFHGADWPAMREKYRPLLAHVPTRADLNRVIQWMCSELAVGHHRISNPGDLPEPSPSVPGGLLGADYEVADGRYRFARIYGGLNWTPDLRAPLTEPGIDVRPGDYLIAVNGRDVRATANLYEFFENTAGKSVEITVSTAADGRDGRAFTVVPVASEAVLRNRAWVEANLRRVTEATAGRVAYVYVPNTSTQGHDYFKRYFFPQADREAIILDERFNGGGSVADYYIDILRRPLVSYWAMRYGGDLRTPAAAILGPKVMLVNEEAGSGGDLLPWMFRKFALGPIVGKRTWGGLVGILGFPEFIDGGSVTAPNLAIWTGDGFIVENEGVPPDVEVEQTPAEVIAGRDPQLERAIEMALAELKTHPQAPPVRPPFPVRVRR